MNKIQMWIDNIIDRRELLEKCPLKLKGVDLIPLTDRAIHVDKGIEKIANALGIDEVHRIVDDVGDERVSLFYRDHEIRQWNYCTRESE